GESMRPATSGEGSACVGSVLGAFHLCYWRSPAARQSAIGPTINGARSHHGSRGIRLYQGESESGGCDSARGQRDSALQIKFEKRTVGARVRAFRAEVVR